ncbi:9792_t:CDS:2 [Dentiscutata heterogama]|uniref:9792_t:CDS:1 n=1 Tax=Dentiscutata heterogama TaxID=1316150 RepID=A0ACA9LPL4_9GLOM|nr:9792_t:CDS:2 [Dentiscutata heterogama]
MRSHGHAFIVRPFLLWTLVFLSLLFIFTYAKSKLDSKELVQFTPPNFSRLVRVVNALPPKLDLSPINLVLISTLDGNLHGVDRYTGQVLWSLEGAVEGSLIKTFTRSSTKQQNVTGQDEFEYDGLFDDNDNSRMIDDSQLTKLNGDLEEEEDPDLEITYIVEPNNDGILYMFSPKTGLQTVKQLVMNSPFRSVDGKVFIVGSKSTKFFAIDPATGKILQSFNSDNELENECPSTAYKISIYNERGKPKWNLTYTEYVPHSFDANIELIYNTSPDGHYISSTHNGEVLSTDSKNGEHNWYQQFSSPAVGIFDVLASKELSSGLHIVRQPRPTIAHYNHLPQQKPSQLSAYVGNIDGTLFVMSVENYPLTQSMPFGISGNMDDENKVPENNERCHPGSSIYPKCLVGNHMMTTFEQTVQVIDPPLKDNTTRIPMISTKPQITAQVEYRKRFGSLFENKFMGFFKRSPQRDSLATKPGGKKDSPKKNKKRGKSTVVTKSTVVIKKSDVKDDEKMNKLPLVKGAPAKELLPIVDNVSVLLAGNPGNSNLDNCVVPAITNHVTTIVSNTVNGELKLNSLVVTDIILGYGSHGTIVYKGSFEGRDVAVKRLLLDFYEIAYHEVSLLQESDDHPNVIRYFCKEQCDRFLYIALELCPASLYDLIERGSTFQHAHLLASLHPPSKILYQIVAGLHHLHSMKIVHRDIKPQNILIAPSKNKKIIKDGVSQASVRVLISDFGLCKKLDGESSSFHNTTNNIGGTIGWRAPELLSPPSLDGTNNGTEEVWTSVDRLNDNSFTSSSSGSDHDNGQPRRITKSIDIFSAGCLFYYVLSGGDHPFGDRYSREINILKGVYELNKLDGMGEEGIEARDLIERMIERDPKKRPKAGTVMIHPYFWSPSKRLSFLQDASDRFEIEERDPPSQLLQRLEQGVGKVIGSDWHKRIDKVFIENLGKYRKYDGTKIRDLLRALRNKKHHYQDLPEQVKRALGQIPDGFLLYFTSRFPNLMLHVYYVIAEFENLRNESIFKHYFEIPGEM